MRRLLAAAGQFLSPLGRGSFLFLAATPCLLHAGTENEPTHLSGGKNIYDYLNRTTSIPGSVDINGGSQYLVLDDVLTEWKTSYKDWTSAGTLSIEGQNKNINLGTNYLLWLGGGTHTLILHDIEFIGSNSSTYPLFYITNAGTTNMDLSGSVIRNVQHNSGTRSPVFNITNNNAVLNIDGGAKGATFLANANIALADYGNAAGANIGGGTSARSGVLNMEATNATVNLSGKLNFKENSSNSYGGVISVYGLDDTRHPSLTSTVGSHIVFESNTAKRFGGAINIWGGGGNDATGVNVTFNGTTDFLYNSAISYYHPTTTTGGKHRGGAINIGDYSGRAILTFNAFAKFIGNKAVSEHPETSALNKSNDAIGGAISLYSQHSAATAYYSLFINKGAIFRDNFAHSVGTSGYGGAIYYQGTAITTFTITGPATFEDNYAKTFGGAIYLNNTTTTNNILTLKSVVGGDILFKGNRHDATFSNNTGNWLPEKGSGKANAVYLAKDSTLNLQTDAGSKIDFFDPIEASTTASGNKLTKSGLGEVIFYEHDTPINISTKVEGGFFRLRAANGSVAKYGSATTGEFVVSSNAAVTLGDGSELRSKNLIVSNLGKILVESSNASTPTTSFIKATNFSIANRGGLGGHGTLRVLDQNEQLSAISATGASLHIYAENPLLNTAEANAAAVFRLDNHITGSAQLIKSGAGTYVLENEKSSSGSPEFLSTHNTHTGGTRVDEGTLFLSSVEPGTNGSLDPAKNAQWKSSFDLGTGPITVNDGVTDANDQLLSIATLKIRPTLKHVDTATTTPITGTALYGSYTIDNVLTAVTPTVNITHFGLNAAGTAYDKEVVDRVHQNFGRGLIDVDLKAEGVKADNPSTSSPVMRHELKFENNVQAYNARILLQNLDLKLKEATAHTVTPATVTTNGSLGNTRLELGAGARVFVPSGTSYLGGVKFASADANAPAFLRFENVS
ncbi:MAG: hypothetical protein LBG65_01040, partial [Puniceicoccales bacterium]|nr:hypothetical protein [Puniceicoccales bacterium]